MVIGHLYVFFKEMSIQIICSLLNYLSLCMLLLKFTKCFHVYYFEYLVQPSAMNMIIIKVREWRLKDATWLVKVT